MFKACLKEKKGKRICGLCHSMGYHPFGYHDFSRSVQIAWFGCMDGQEFFSKNIGYNMEYKGTDTEYQAVMDTIKNVVLVFFEEKGFDKTFDDLEKKEVIDFVVKIINGYRDNLHIRISEDNPDNVKEFMNVNGLELTEKEEQEEVPFDDEIPW